LLGLLGLLRVWVLEKESKNSIGANVTEERENAIAD